MNEIITLLKLHVKTTYGLSAFRYNIRRNPLAAFKSIVMALCIVLVVCVLVGGYAAMLFSVFRMLKQAGFEQLVLLSGVFMVMGIVLIFGFFHILSTIFFPRDAAFLASLPVRSQSVFLSKFLLVMIDEYLIALPIIAVPGIMYGVYLDCGIAYYLRLVVLALFLPTLPLAVGSLVSLALMRVASEVKKRSTLVSIGSFILMAGFCIGQAAFSSFIAGGMGKQMIEGLIKNQTDLIGAASRFFPPIGWAVGALAGEGYESPIKLMLFVAVSLLAMLLAVEVSKRIYQKGALAQTEAAKTGIAVRYEKVKQSSAVMALFTKEWKTIIRTPVYAMNCLVFIVIGPLFFNKFLFGGILMSDPDVKPAFDILAAKGDSPPAALIMAGILAVIGSMNMAASTTISREGRMFWLSKAMPVEPGHQLIAKSLATYSMSALAVLTSGITISWSFGLNYSTSIRGHILALAATVATVLISVIIDVSNPKLTWDNQTQAVKQNVNAMIAMIAGLVLVGGSGYLGYLALSKGADPGSMFWYLLCLFAIVSAGALAYMLKNAENRYKAIK